MSAILLIHGSAMLPHALAQTSVSVPFVGCASDGQLGPRKPPHGRSKPVSLTPELASHLAFYQAEDGSGTLAPRGWHCFGTYGSNGGSLFVAPQPIESKLLFSDMWKGFSGAVVQVSDSIGGTSGRFEVASIIARVFPAHKRFVTQVIAEGIEPAADFPFGPYPKDKLLYRSKNVVEYTTPPRTEGLGTRSRLQSNDDPITGVEILSGPNEELNLISVSVRLPHGSEDVAQAIFQQAEHGTATDHTK